MIRLSSSRLHYPLHKLRLTGHLLRPHVLASKPFFQVPFGQTGSQ